MISLFKTAKSHSKTKLRKHLKKTAEQEDVRKVYQQFVNADNKKNERKSLLKLIELAYDHPANQLELVEVLQLPYEAGPVSLHAFPSVLLEQNQVIGGRGECEEGELTQLEFLFNFLRNVRECYYCWVIYFNEDLKILNVKLLKREEIEEHQDLFNPVLNLIGIFITKPPKPKLFQTRSQFAEEYYGEERRQADANHHNKSISTINSSTGTTWKAVARMEKINEDNEDMDASSHKQAKERAESKAKPKLKESKKHSVGKLNQEPRPNQKQSKSFSIKQLKEKSKSHILLSRSSSNNFREIILEPIKHEGPPAAHKFKLHPKSKLKKEAKPAKMASIYFKRPVLD